MDKQVVFEKIKNIFTSIYELEADSISLDKKLDDDLELDSLDMVDLVIALNDEKGLLTEQIEPTIFKNVKTVRDIVDTISPYMSDFPAK